MCRPYRHCFLPCGVSFLLSAWLLFLMVLPARAQLTEPVYSAPTPDVATLGTFGEIPVSLFTGTPDISVPIYDITAGDFSFPISLSYHLAAVKPNLPPGNYGLGWALSTDACISRTVRGVPDEKMDSQGIAHGFYGHHAKMKNITPAAFASMTASGLQSSPSGNDWYELSADEFAFSFNGYSGNFYLNPDGGWTVVSDQDIRVDFDPSSGGFLSLDDLASRIPGISSWANRGRCTRWFGSFTLITPDGTRYTFGGADATDFSIDYYARSSADLIATAWHLTRIVTPQGRQITFSYAAQDRPIMADIRYVSGRRTTYGIAASSPQYLDTDIRGRRAYSGFLLFPARLHSIVSPNETVELTYTPDWNYGSRFLSFSPDVLYWDDTQQRLGGVFSFNPDDPALQFFELMPGTNTGSLQSNRRAIAEALRHDFLHRISIYHAQEGYGRTIYLEYEGSARKRLAALRWREGNPPLEYDYFFFGNVVYPLLTTPADSSDTSLPAWHFHYNTEHSMPLGTVFPNTDAWGYWNGGVKSPAQTYYDSANPTPAPLIFATAETLRAVTFPTGGSVRLAYERHTFSKVVPDDHGSPEEASGSAGGLRIKALTLTDRLGNTLSEKRYHYTADLTSLASSGISAGNPTHRQTFVLPGGESGMVILSESGFASSTTGFNSPHVGYSAVIEETRGPDGSPLGFVRYRFSNFDTDIHGIQHPDHPAFYAYNVSGSHAHVPFTSNSVQRGRLLSKEYFSRDTLPERTQTWHYALVRNDSLATATQETVFLSSDPLAFLSANIGWLTRTHLASYLPVKEETYEYSPAGTAFSTVAHAYNDLRLTVRDSTLRSDGSFIVRHYSYPDDHPDLYDWMIQRHILDAPVSIRTATSGGVHYQTAEYASVQGPLGEPVPYLAASVSGREGSSLVRNHFRVLTADSWGNPTNVIQDALRHRLYWTADGQRLSRTTSHDPDHEPLPFSPVQTRSIPGSGSILFPNPDGSQTRFFIYDPTGNLTFATQPNGLADHYGYDALGRLDSVIENDIADYWNEDRVIRRYRYVYQQSDGASLPVNSAGTGYAAPAAGPEPVTESHAPDGATELFLQKGNVYQTHLEFRSAAYHADSLSNVCLLTVQDSLQAFFDIRNLRYYRSTPVLDSLPDRQIPIALRLYHTPPNGPDSLILQFPFLVQGRTLDVSVDQRQWQSDSVIVSLPPGWFRIDFLGIDPDTEVQPLLRGRTSVIMTDFPSFDLHIECPPLDPGPTEPEPEPASVSSWNNVRTLVSRDGSASTGRISIDWLDDFGRPESSQAIAASPSGKDLISFASLDALQRPLRQWLTTPVSSRIRIPVFPTGQSSDPLRDPLYEHFLPDTLAARAHSYFAADGRPFSEQDYGSSSLDRPSLTYGPGQQWYSHGKAVRSDYLTNIPGDPLLGCLRFTCTPHPTRIWAVSSPGSFAAGALNVTKLTDEDGRVVLSFSDRQGNPVLSRTLIVENGATRYLDTYFVHDGFGNLLAVLPPLASAALQNGVIPNDALQKFAYLYTYDALDRPVLKKIPGAEPVRYVYDAADRIILTQDGNDRNAGTALFSLYDVFGRLCVTGYCSNSVSDGMHLSSVVKAVYTGDGLLGGYTVQGLELDSPSLLTVNWYDDYDFIADFLGHPQAAADSLLLFGTPAARTDALQTGSWAAVIDPTGTVPQEAVWSVIRYDRRNRPAKTLAADHLGGWTVEDVRYTFQGAPAERRVVHHEPSGRVRSEDYAYTYDSQERLLSVTHALDAGTPVVLANNTYDDLGRPASTAHAGAPALAQAYGYNIRSQLTGISGPLFSERLYYQEPSPASPNASVNFGGDISSMEWKAAGMSDFAGWDFSYDSIGRLSGAVSRFGTTLTGDYDSAYSYDDHGNILSIREEGLSIPLRTFSYSGNRLAGASYDHNGNLTGDPAHGPKSIRYNRLNLPELIHRSAAADTVRYAYAADGTKLRETVSKRGVLLQQTDYAGSRIYRDGQLHFILGDHDAYLAFPDSLTGLPRVPGRIFLLRDHLGSVRVAADQDGSARQVNHYYPYGGDLVWNEPLIPVPDTAVIIIDPIRPAEHAHPEEPIAGQILPDNPFKFIGKEKAAGSGFSLYDFGARFYTPAIPRWTTPDPLAEKYYPISPYAYCAGNPVNLVDPDGNNPILLGVIGGAADFGLQIGVYMLNGASFNDAFRQVDWTSVAASAAVGAVNPSTTVRKVAIVLAITAIDAAADYTEDKGWEIIGQQGEDKKDIGDAAIDFATGVISGSAGSLIPDKIANGLSKEASNRSIMAPLTAGERAEKRTIAHTANNTYVKETEGLLLESFIQGTRQSVRIDFNEKKEEDESKDYQVKFGIWR